MKYFTRWKEKYNFEQEKNSNKNHKDFKVGDFVAIRNFRMTNKGDRRWLGPGKVIALSDNDKIWVLLNGKNTCRTYRDVKKWTSDVTKREIKNPFTDLRKIGNKIELSV